VPRYSGSAPPDKNRQLTSCSIAKLFDGRSWEGISHVGYLIRPLALMTPWPTKYGKMSTGRLAVDTESHASAALADFIEDGEEGNLCCRWKRRPAADFRIPLYQKNLWGAGEGVCAPNMCRMVPAEPGVCDRVLTEVQIGVELPSSETASYSRLKGWGGMPSGSTLIALGDGGAMGAAFDLRKMTGVGLRRCVATAVGVPVKHVKLRLGYDGEGGVVGEMPGCCILTAYARRTDGAGLALRLSLGPG